MKPPVARGATSIPAQTQRNYANPCVDSQASMPMKGIKSKQGNHSHENLKGAAEPALRKSVYNTIPNTGKKQMSLISDTDSELWNQ